MAPREIRRQLAVSTLSSSVSNRCPLEGPAAVNVLRRESAVPDVRQPLGTVVNREDVNLVIADQTISAGRRRRRRSVESLAG